MKTKAATWAIALASLMGASLLFAGPLDKAWMKGTTDKNPLLYKPGEEMVFTVEPQNIRGDLPAGTYFLKWERTGDDGVSEKGSEPLTGKPFVYKTRIAKPGFVRLYAEVVDASGKPFRRNLEKFAGDPSTPEGRRALKRLKQMKSFVFFDGGAAAGADTLRQAAPEPADFDAFWARQKAELKKVPFNAKRVEVPCGNPDVRLYALSVDCTGGKPVTGYLSIPKAAEKGKKFGIHIGTPGYGVGEQFPPRHPAADAIGFKMNAHGFLLREFGGTDEYYWTYGDKIKSNGYTYAFDPQQNSNPETAYMRGMILRLIRAIQYLKSCPEWDGKDLQVAGGSQGGAFAIWGAGCGEGVTHVHSSVTGFCDIGAELAGRLRGPWPRIKFVEALGYFDAVNFAKRVPATCRVDITRAGLGDYTCQPSGIAVLWNTLKCPKSILWMQGSEHGYVPPDYEGRDFKFEREPTDQDPAWAKILVQVKSTLDGTLQPCYFWAPDESKTNAVPLIVGLHTWSADYQQTSHYATVLKYARAKGWAMVGPNFRGPNKTPPACGGDPAVQDIVDAVNYAKAHVKIDSARVYIVGGSGGGHMTLLMLGRHPEIFAAGAAFCPITDLARWHADSLLVHPGRGKHYAKMLEGACGGTPAEKPEEYAHRSPLTWLDRARKAGVGAYIVTGIHDGWKGSVPVGHSFRAFNALANPEDRVSEADIAAIEETQQVPAALVYDGPKDPFYSERMRIHFRRTSANVRFTLMEGGHGGNFAAGLDFLSRQAKGRPTDFSLPSAGKGREEALGK